MQIIQGIREKGAAIVIGVIALSLIGFILMDARQGASRLFGSSSTSVGKVNGTSIELQDFNKRMVYAQEETEGQYQRKLLSSEISGVRDNVWNLYVIESVVYKEAAKLGIDFSQSNLSSILSSNDPNENPLLQDKNMMDSTGKLDRTKLATAFSNIKKFTGDAKDRFDYQVTNRQRLNSIAGRYLGYLNAAAYYPTWMQERDNKESKEFAQVNYVNISYSAIADSTIKVTDDEINEYVKKHKLLYKQEAGRMISYVSFSQLPNATDSAKIKEAVASLKEGFAADNNASSFIARNSSVVDYDSSYKSKASMGSVVADSIIRMAVGSVYGPYVQGKNYMIAKFLGVKTLPDSVKARHILIGTYDPQTKQPIMDDSVAHKLADSVYDAIKGGMDFTLMAFKYSTDMSNRFKGGDLGFFGNGQMVPEFNDYSFNNPIGSMKVVKTMYGYHIVNITAVKGSSPAYRVGYIAKEIFPSDNTINQASNAASKFSSDKDPKRFDSASLKKAGMEKITVSGMLKENDYSVERLQDARALVKWAFSAKAGDVSEPFNIGDQFVVAQLDKEMKEGLQDAATARPKVERFVRNEKKADLILKKIGATPTLESAAAAYAVRDTTVGLDSSLTYLSRSINQMDEAKLIGACFNKDNLNKIAAPLVGKYGVYVLKVNNVGLKTADPADQALAKKKAAEDQLRAKGTANWIEGLKSQASIKDKRADIF